MRWFYALRTRLRLLLGRTAAESRMTQEFRFHLDMETERLMRDEGLTADEARRRALLAFGGVDRFGEELRDGRGRAWLSGLSLDFRLGLRMLAKYPGLAVIGGLGMAVAIAIAAVSYGMIFAMMDRSLPFDEGDRVVMIQNTDARLSNPNRATHLHGFELWREPLPSVEDVGAFRTLRRNLLQGEGEPELVRVAEMSAAGFTLARVPPLHGRFLLAADESPGAPDVVVIGEAVWRHRFAADPRIIGRQIQLGTRAYTVVGIMPAEFRFPVNHEFWTPLRLQAADYAPGAAPSIEIFARLADGASLSTARTEAQTVSRRLATSNPAVYASISTHVMPYTFPFFDVDAPGTMWLMRLIQLLISLLLVVVGVNVAILMYARTASRQGEITVRTALGASRRRIVLQLFAEAFVLAGFAAGAGLLTASLVLRRLGELLRNEFGAELPFWMDPSISTGMTLYVVGLAIIAALIVGVVPALKATGQRIQSTLRSLGAGATGLQLGRTWTLLIIAQVAIAVAVLPAAIHNALQSARFGMADPGFAAEEYVQAYLSLEQEQLPGNVPLDQQQRIFRERFGQATSQLVQRLESEAMVADVTFAYRAPGEDRWIRVNVSGATNAATSRNESPGINNVLVSYNRVATDFFQAFDVPLLAGRAFEPGDAVKESPAVIVNRAFVDAVFGSGNPLGRVVRYTAPSWETDPDLNVDRQFEIVGVVPDFPNSRVPGERMPRIYRALAAGHVNPTALLVRMQNADAAAYARRLREITIETDAMLELDDAVAMNDAGREYQTLMRMIAIGVLIATFSVILLSSAGIYAMMSFTVARRRREIGIRAALGAPPAQLIGAVFSRAATQLVIGVLVGVILAAALDLGMEGGYTAMLAPVAIMMILVGMLAAAGPARRGLRIQPTETLRDE